MKHDRYGFTLLEMLLVLAIIGVLAVMGVNYLQQRTMALRVDKTAADMQQILAAALAYYVANGKWPNSAGGGNKGGFMTCLQGAGCSDASGTVKYLPAGMKDPWRYGYLSSFADSSSPYYVYAYNVPSNYAYMIANKVPLGFVTTEEWTVGTPTPQDCDTLSCKVVASVNMPGQNLNNSTAVNFAGIYNPGGCVPVPTCAQAGMEPQILVAPVSVTGYSQASDVDGSNPIAYPLTNFTAHATGPDPTNPSQCEDGLGGGFGNACDTDESGATAQQYWRVCLQVVTEQGNLPMTSVTVKGLAVMAITRCSIPNASRGSSYFTVYGGPY